MTSLVSQQHRLWQMDARFMEIMARKAAGLSPDTLDDEYTRIVAEWLGMDPEPLDWTEDGIAIVTISGPLYKRKSPFASNYRSITEAIDILLGQRPRAVVLKVDSPGGVCAGLEPVVRKVAQLAEHTLTVACVAGVCCSAAYRIASQAGTIVASSDSEIGSIGTFWQFIDCSEAFAKEGLRSVMLTTGPFKGTGAMGEPITDEQRAWLQEITDKTNAGFLADVRTARDLTDDELAAVSDGRFWMAEESLGLKLIDQIGTLSDVLTAIRSQTTEVAEMPKPKLQPAASQSAPEADPETTATEETPAETPAGEPEASAPAAPAQEPAAAQRGLSDYMQAFGDAEGARMFRDQIAWDEACAQTIAELRGQLQDARAENSQLRGRVAELGKAVHGERSAVNLSDEAPRKKSFSEACRAGKPQR